MTLRGRYSIVRFRQFSMIEINHCDTFVQTMNIARLYVAIVVWLSMALLFPFALKGMDSPLATVAKVLMWSYCILQTLRESKRCL